MKKFLPLIFSFIIIVGGVLFWKYSGAAAAVQAQNEIKDKGFYYSGDIWMTPDAYQALKSSLSKRDSSIQTSNDLVILPDADSGKLHIKYAFFSAVNYDGLNKTRDFPSQYKYGFAFIPTVASLLFVLFLIAWSFKVAVTTSDKLSSNDAATHSELQSKKNG